MMASSTPVFKSKIALKSRSGAQDVAKLKNSEKLEEYKIPDKQNNHVKFQTSGVPVSKAPRNFGNKQLNLQQCSMNKTGKGITKLATANVDAANSVVNGKANIPSNAIPKSRQRSSIAASYLAKTADGLAKTPKRTQNFDKNQTMKQETVHSKSPASQQNSPKKYPPFSTPQKRIPTADKETNLYRSSCKMNMCDKNLAVSSPTVAKIPCDIVRQRVDIIQTSRWSPKAAKDLDQPKQVGQIRKSLAAVFEQRRSIKVSRRSCITGQNDEADTEDFSVTVAVRVRPLNARESDLKAKQVVFMNGNETVVTDGVSEHSFCYDHSFWSFDKQQCDFASQRRVYEKLAKPLLCAAFDGYNTCLFAYGQTGSGKSYTIMGLGDDKGVVPRFCDEMFACIQSKEKQHSNVRYHVQVSYFEIYNEKIHDLLVSSSSSGSNQANNSKQVLRVREHPELGPYVEGLSKFIVSSYEDVQAWIEVGNRQRATASTGMNDKSSRSHSVFTLNLVQTTMENLEGENHESNCRSLINLVDLAGSERSRTAGTSGQRLKEGASINKSLLTLGKVISALSERSTMPMKRRKKLFVPYRDSTLTWILKESLGGNSRTAMIATISPASCHMEETLSTLRYAKQARSIVNLVKINEDPNARIIRELKAEIAKLKEASGQNKIDPNEFQASLLEVTSLRKLLSAAEKEKAQVQEEWKKKLEQSEKRKAEELTELKRAGVSFKVDNQLPNLVNLNEDPQLSELLLYMIKRGVTRVGKKGGDCDIQLNGALISPLHCVISNIDDVVSIEPINDAATYVNGEQITKAEILHHGDRVIIGGDHFFRLNNPIEVQREGRKRNSGGKRKDFEFAKLELIERQNERLQKEVHEAQLQVKKEMLGEIEAAKQEAEVQITTQKTKYEKEIKTLQDQLVKDKEEKKNLKTVFEQAEVLHQQFKISKKNRPIEANPSQVDSDDVKIQVFASLEAERKKLSEEIERMQHRKDGTKKSPKPDSVISLQLSLLLQEANNISTSLDKQTHFSIHDSTDDQSSVKIKVHNTQMGIWTLWSLEKFEANLEVMREMYNDPGSENDEWTNIFNDPDDEWQEAYNQTSLLQPATSKKQSQRLSRRLSSLVLARASPALQESLSRLNRKCSPGAASEGPYYLRLCKRLLSDPVIETGDCSSIIDKLLLSLQHISTASTRIAQIFNENEEYMESSEFEGEAFNVSMSSHTLHLLVSSIKSNVSDNPDAPSSVSKLVMQAEKAAKELTGHITKLLQGCDTGLEQLVQQSTSRITRLAPNISKYMGAVAIATELPVTLFNEEHQQKLTHRLKHAFLQGGDTFMRKVLSGGIERLSEIEKENIAVRPDDYENLSTAAITQLKMCMELQQELYDSSLILNEHTIPVQYYSEYLQRTQTLIREIGFLLEGVTQISKRASDNGNESCSSNDLRHNTESLWQSTSRIAELCVKHEGLHALIYDLSTSQVPALTYGDLMGVKKNEK